MTEIAAPSPNHDERGTAIDMIVLHYTGMKTGEEALDRMRDPAAKVSAHLMIETDGRVFRLVPDDRRAWHAGVAAWAGATDINARSIGIEIVNPGHEWGYTAFPTAQTRTVFDLVAALRGRYGVPAARVVGHADVAPHRKEDPGEAFPWRALAEAGHAVAPWDGHIGPDLPDGAEAMRLMSDIGYAVERFGNAACAVAFQRRFAPTELGQGLNPGTRAAIAQVAAGG